MNTCWKLLWMILLLSIIYPCYVSSKKIVCYYAKRSEERNYAYRLDPEDIDVSLCTHLVYACSIPDLTEGVLPTQFLRSLTSEGGAGEFTKLRKLNTNLSLILSIGGWHEGSIRFSKIASKHEDTKWFARHAIDIVRYIGFDGIDINWQWPGLREGGTDEDKIGLVKLIQALKRQIIKDSEERMKKPLELTLVLPPLKEIVAKGFDLNALRREVDYFTLMTMDYYLSTDPHINHHAPLFSLPYKNCIKDLSVEATVEYYLGTGIEPERMVLGIPLYGNSYTLENEYDTNIGAEAEDEGIKGFGAKLPGTLAYFEICKYVKDYGWTVKSPNTTAMGPYAFLLKNWVAYDDPDIIRKKVQYGKQKCLGGVMLWTIDMDDFKGWCNERFPLTKAARYALLDPSVAIPCTPAPSVLTQIVKETTTTTTSTTTTPTTTTTSNPTVSNQKPFKMVKRAKWEASPPTEDIPKLRVFPAPYVIITNTVSQSCSTFAECKSIVKNIQSYHISIGFGDIGYSFLVGGDGIIYEGLGWNRHGAHTLPFNARSIGIAFIGDFSKVAPPQKQVDAALRLIAESLRLGQLRPDYKLFGQRQVIAVLSPGTKLMEIIKTWPHWTEYDPTEHDED